MKEKKKDKNKFGDRLFIFIVIVLTILISSHIGYQLGISNKIEKEISYDWLNNNGIIAEDENNFAVYVVTNKCAVIGGSKELRTEDISNCCTWNNQTRYYECSFTKPEYEVRN